MSNYQQILVAIDLSKESNAVVEKAMEISAEACEMQLVFVQEPMDSVYVGVVPQSAAFSGLGNLELQLRAEVKAKMKQFGERYGVPESNQHIISGSPAREIHRFAEESGTDLIVIGTHGQKGLQLLLGSTANAVLHGSGCDVLAVRIKQ